MTRVGCDFGRFGLPKPSPKVEGLWGVFLVLFCILCLCCFGSPPRRPRGAQEAPRPPQERLERLQEAAKSTPGGPKRSPRHPRSRSRGLKTLQDRPKRLEKNTIPKTIVHINVADIAEIDKDKTLLTRGAVKKGRAGGGVPPWGRQSAATRRVGACPDGNRICLRILRTQRV